MPDYGPGPSAPFAAALASLLSGSAALAAKVSDRIYPVEAPPLTTGQTLPPTVVWRFASRAPDAAIDGAIARLQTTIVEVACMATSYLDAQIIGDLVEHLLVATNGPAGDPPVNIHARLSARNDEVTFEVGVFTVFLEFEIHHTL